MTPGEVLDEIIADERITHFRTSASESNQCADVIGMFGALLYYMRADYPQHLPLSPVEVERMRVGLRTIVSALHTAHERSPAHIYVVRKGGR